MSLVSSNRLQREQKLQVRLTRFQFKQAQSSGAIVCRGGEMGIVLRVIAGKSEAKGRFPE